jgi:hypothetical protein
VRTTHALAIAQRKKIAPHADGQAEGVKSRHGRACPGHPRLEFLSAVKSWMPGIKPGMT